MLNQTANTQLVSLQKSFCKCIQNRPLNANNV